MNVGLPTVPQLSNAPSQQPPRFFQHLQVYVDQPTVPQTVSILRGLRERYELHHGVRINDSALVEAAVLSDRYIADRWGCTGGGMSRCNRGGTVTQAQRACEGVDGAVGVALCNTRSEGRCKVELACLPSAWAWEASFNIKHRTELRFLGRVPC